MSANSFKMRLMMAMKNAAKSRRKATRKASRKRRSASARVAIEQAAFFFLHTEVLYLKLRRRRILLINLN